MTDWRAFEPIPPAMGGGAIVKGPLGCLHLVGAAWSWWLCPTCVAVERHLRETGYVRDLIEETT